MKKALFVLILATTLFVGCGSGTDSATGQGSADDWVMARDSAETDAKRQLDRKYSSYEVDGNYDFKDISSSGTSGDRTWRCTIYVKNCVKSN